MLIVVLNFNGAPDTIECLASLEKQTYRKITTLVIDNGSQRNGAEPIRAACPGVWLIQLEENLGWAGGNNVGIRLGLEQNFDLICLLNNDTVVEAPAIERMVATAASLPPCLLHPALYYYDDQNEPQLDPDKGGWGKLHDGHTGIFRLDFAYGACLMVHHEIFRKVGLLDERFFLQLEEADLYERAHRAGYESLCMPAARVLHKESRTFGTRLAPQKTYYTVRNSLLLAEKHTTTIGGFKQAAAKLYWGLGNIARRDGLGHGILPFTRWAFSRDPFAKAARRGLRDYCLRRFGRAREAFN